MARRNHLTLILISAVAAFFVLSWKFSSPRTGSLSFYSDSSSSSRTGPDAGSSGDDDGSRGASKATVPNEPASHRKPGSKPDAKTGGEKYGAHDRTGTQGPVVEQDPETKVKSSPEASSGTPSALDSLTDLSTNVLSGGVIASKLGNETLKAELGRASWKLFHTMMARFPEEATADDSAALKAYITLFARLYPCGECAGHFQQLLSKFPPQVSGRNAAAGWACHVHNKVNERLGKDIFDCNNIGDFYDCGCGEEEEEKGEESANSKGGGKSDDKEADEKQTAAAAAGKSKEPESKTGAKNEAEATDEKKPTGKEDLKTSAKLDEHGSTGVDLELERTA